MNTTVLLFFVLICAAAVLLYFNTCRSKMKQRKEEDKPESVKQDVVVELPQVVSFEDKKVPQETLTLTQNEVHIQATEKVVPIKASSNKRRKQKAGGDSPARKQASKKKEPAKKLVLPKTNAQTRARTKAKS